MDSEIETKNYTASTEEDLERPADPPRQESTDIAATFSLFKDHLDKKLIVLKEDLKDTTDLVAKKLKETSELTFKYEGNKKQYKFNRDLADHVSTAITALQRKETSQVSKSLQELEKQLKRRNKLIRLADKAPAGWDLINEYLSDELASGSEDEKRIKKAEQTAFKEEDE